MGIKVAWFSRESRFRSAQLPINQNKQKNFQKNFWKKELKVETWKKCFKKRIIKSATNKEKKVVAHLVFVTFFANGYIIKGCFGLFGRSEIEAERKKSARPLCCLHSDSERSRELKWLWSRQPQLHTVGRVQFLSVSFR